ncbi:GNAT family N-acetyltransferase [Candidatus Thiodictyon syntrophicum]|uniref:GNAT family N-acetyltransferase n=1 Tax=Candidatus Thiodictyon syntrophicum TaxID=1166950 RepID=A0A2K8UHG7_9GAMM|nr:GNAT family N-acetyltransferase [Candidatus Thiodictyon syntrophicum]AUB84988.1 GNAT family N-acetyltransferase [Candidatus Thiodictyon syntrophicum]
MSKPPVCIEPLGRQDRSGFDCGAKPLDLYFRTQVSQDIRRRLTACYVAIAQDSGRVAGFYTLSAGQVPLPSLPPDLRKKLPRYPAVPVVRLGRLAVDRDFTGRGFGAALLVDAIKRVLSSDIAAFAILVDAKDAPACAFYRHHGFIDLVEPDSTLVMPLAGVARRLDLSLG